jgi:hypothetical protein
METKERGMATTERESTEAQEIDRLTKIMRLGFGSKDVRVTRAGGHTSKSCSLPIMSGGFIDSNVAVTNLSYNWYFHFLGVQMTRPINAMLLYPISGAFGKYALSGHTDTDGAPPIGNFLREYHTAAQLSRWGMDAGSALEAAMIIRHLQEASKIDAERIMDICLRKTNYGRMDAIDGNAIDFDDLMGALGLRRLGKDPYEFEVALGGTKLFKRITIDWFDSERGHNLVHVELADPANALLPSMPLPAEVLVDLRDTPLAAFVPESAHTRQTKGEYGPKCMVAVPTAPFPFKERPTEQYQRIDGHPYPVHGAYAGAGLDTVRFTFKTLDPLCAAMTAWFLVNVAEPVLGSASTFGVTRR